MPSPPLHPPEPIVYLISSLPPKTGGEIYAYKLYQYLERRGRAQEYLPIDKMIHEIRLRLLPYFRRLVYMGWLGDLLTSLGLAFRLKKLKGVLVEDQYHSFLLLVTNVVHRWFRRGRIITLVHQIEHYASDAPPSWRNWLWKWRERLSLGRSDALVTVSEYTKREIASLGIPEDKIMILPPGLDREKLNPPTGKHGTDLLCVAHIIRRKGILSLVEAFALLKAAGIRLHLAGALDIEPDYVAQVRALAEKQGAADRVIFHGLRRPAELGPLFSQAGIFVFPSLQEGFGISLLEAMYYGLPIVTSNLSAIPELVEEGVNGLLVPPGEAKPMADAIQRLLDDPKLRETLGHRGRQLVESKFHWETTCEGFANLIDEPTAQTSTARTPVLSEGKPHPL
jgi:glycosyltransferase involved in cell wall biosynthesis